MNKVKLFFLAALFVVGAGTVNAQGQKAGYFNIESMISLMPEVGRIDTLLQRFQNDSLNAEFQSLVQDYQYKDSLLTKTDTAKIPPATRRQYRIDLQNTAYQVQNWQQISQNVMQNKQQELLAPVYQRVYAALNQVAKENGYGFVYREEALLIAPPGDNLLPLVAKKLNVKLPTGQGQPGAGQAGTRSTTPATQKPAPKGKQ